MHRCAEFYESHLICYYYGNSCVIYMIGDILSVSSSCTLILVIDSSHRCNLFLPRVIQHMILYDNVQDFRVIFTSGAHLLVYDGFIYSVVRRIIVAFFDIKVSAVLYDKHFFFNDS